MTRIEIIRLIADIEYMQRERWQRLKRFHNINTVSIKTRHLFMQKDVDLMRRQKARLRELKASIYQ